MDLSLESILGDKYLDFECPGCKHNFNVKFKEVMQEGNKITCPSCESLINITHDENSKRELEKANESLRDFERT